MALTFYTSLTKGLKLKVRKFWGLIPTFGEIAGEKLVGVCFLPLTPPSPPNILNSVKAKTGITPELMKGVFEFTDVLKGTILKRHLLQVKNYGTKFPQK